MPKPSARKIAKTLLKLYGKTYAEELGIRLNGGNRESLFRLLCAAMLFSTRIHWKIAEQAAAHLAEKGWTTPETMAKTSWEERVKALDEARYVRYDEGTSLRLGEMAGRVVAHYGGDLRNLRAEARRDPKKERELIEEFKGIGGVGADIFCREAQTAWDELYPFLDAKARASARRLGLPADAQQLSRLCEKKDYSRLVAALVRVGLDKDYGRVLREARQ